MAQRYGWLRQFFPTLASISHGHVQIFLRFLNGMADFARVNAHEPRWSAFPGLRDSNLKRACLFCYKSNKQQCLDSEWHTLFECKLCSAPRNRFRLALRASPGVSLPISVTRRRKPTSKDLATFLIKCRTDERLVRELARFVVDSISNRQRAFRKLSVRDILPTVS